MSTPTVTARIARAAAIAVPVALVSTLGVGCMKDKAANAPSDYFATEAPDVAREPSPETVAAVRAYEDWFNGYSARLDRTDADVAQGLRLLSAAIGASAAQIGLADQPDIAARLASVDGAVRTIQATPSTPARAGQVRRALDDAAVAMDTIAYARFGSDSAALRMIWSMHQSVGRLDPNRTVLQQQEAVADYFRAALPALADVASVDVRSK